jgi:helix-turn-helix protein
VFETVKRGNRPRITRSSATPGFALLAGVALSFDVVGEPGGVVNRVWTSQCDRATSFSSIAAVHPGIAFARIGGATTVHLRGPETRATMLPCPRDSEYFGVELRLGAYLPMFPPGRLANLRDVVLPRSSDGRILLAGRAWEMPTPQNVDVFVERLTRAGVLVFDPSIEDLRHGDRLPRAMSERTAQSRFVHAVGVSRRKLHHIERTRHAARMLRAGTAIPDVVSALGYYDQPHLTRAVTHLIGHSPAEVARGALLPSL